MIGPDGLTGFGKMKFLLVVLLVEATLAYPGDILAQSLFQRDSEQWDTTPNIASSCERDDAGRRLLASDQG